MVRFYDSLKSRLTDYFEKGIMAGTGGRREAEEDAYVGSQATAQQRGEEKARGTTSKHDAEEGSLDVRIGPGRPEASRAKETIEKMRNIRMPDGQLLGEFADENVRNLKAGLPAEASMNTALAIGWGWQEQALPRLREFVETCPDVRSVEDLKTRMDSMSPGKFCHSILKIRPKNPTQNSRYL